MREIDLPATGLTLKKPDNLKGSLEELKDITPLAWKDDGFNIKKGSDAAQIYGSDIQYKVRHFLPLFHFIASLTHC